MGYHYVCKRLVLYSFKDLPTNYNNEELRIASHMSAHF